ncbi:MAG: hypothetical protein QME60_01485, partial [Verrucomicrobiota bacterium]|nr:hypothetical protein [Verrucomicrobiota bacterium]
MKTSCVLVSVLAVASVCMGLVGCEWKMAGDDGFNSWSDRYKWVNFSGTYRGDNDLLVKKASKSRGGGGGGGDDDGDRVTIRNEPDGVAPPYTGSLSGNMEHLPVVPGSITIVFGWSQSGAFGSFTDDGEGVLDGWFRLFGPDPPLRGNGRIIYDTGVWTLSLAQPGLMNEQPITLNYQYTLTNIVIVDKKPTNDVDIVTAGGSIYTFQVFQNGEDLEILDNNGYRYHGVMAGVKTAGGDDTGMTSGDVIAQYEARGGKKASVTIEGTFRGVYTAPANTGLSGILRNRVIEGTWMED